ncbi:MAG: CusA/CzcA family heavy metal efflux RND transporter [Abditibacteriales bacterium]|nr:CusA/CzcA family heavy metal efflux RND transporter [Abditibacteriales bacterium]MDW8364909.1 CusA/CzcA family heavy metal efflux RND transporter [Abditibacteriales bacterium]
MVDRIIEFSIANRFLMVCAALLIGGLGITSALRLPIDAVPDVTTNQVQINTVAPALAPEEIERLITFPIEVAMSSLPQKEEIRSLSKFGLSQVTVVFEDRADLYWARQQVMERLLEAKEDLPPGVQPKMAPISTGLGEVFQFTVEPDKHPHGPTTDALHPLRELTEMRTLLDWVIKPALRTVPGVIEVNSFGGFEKQYEVQVDPALLQTHNLTLHQVLEALARNNANVGGGYLVHGGEQHLLRGVGMIRSAEDIGHIVVAARHGVPLTIKDIGRVTTGAQIRQGAVTKNGQGEVVAGVTMLLKGANGRVVVEEVKKRLVEVQKSLPPGVRIKPFYDRSHLINATVHTATKNLLEGGALVILVLFLFLLQLRAGLIVSSAIPLSMLIALIGMNYFGVSANLMSLGAIDFGLIVDAAVIIVENCVRRLAERRRALGRPLTREERLQTICAASLEVRRASQFGEMIIIAAYLPILSLGGLEGKMFKPMGLTVVFALVGALVLSLTVIPALCALFLREPQEERENSIVAFFQRSYEPLLRRALRQRVVTVGGAAVLFAACVALFPLLGSEFLPELDEGDILINTVRLPSASLDESVREAHLIEQILKKFPEVKDVITKTGRPEIATDPMGTEMADVFVMLQPKSTWKTARTKAELVEKMEAALSKFPGVAFSFSQPVKFRMMELIEGIGVRSDVGIKIFGEDIETLKRTAEAVARVVRTVRGAADVKVEQITGLPLLSVHLRRNDMARYGINVDEAQRVIQTAIAGTTVTRVIEGDRRFDLTVRLTPEARRDEADIANLLVDAPNGERVPLSQIADIVHEEGPAQISRENARRRIVVEVNVRGRDLGSFVEEARKKVAAQVKLPTGYALEWGGTFEHLESGRQRLMLVVPATFLLVFLLLFTTFHSFKHAALVFTGIPFAVTGGILALWTRGMPFSMSAGVGFIAVSGVAVLNGVVMVTFINQLRGDGMALADAVIQGCKVRLRPVLMTALVASLGFMPMALSHGTGAEVQRPLATVVIGGLMTSTLLTLFVLPALYCWFEERRAEVR